MAFLARSRHAASSPSRRASSRHSSGSLCGPARSRLSRCAAALQHASSLTYLGRGHRVSPTAAPDRRHEPAISPELHRPGGSGGGSWCGERVLSTGLSASCDLGRGHRATRRSLGCFFQSRDAMDRRAHPHTPRYISPLRRSLAGAPPTLKRARTRNRGNAEG